LNVPAAVPLNVSDTAELLVVEDTVMVSFPAVPPTTRSLPIRPYDWTVTVWAQVWLTPPSLSVTQPRTL
jgi:hypothetical protein